MDCLAELKGAQRASYDPRAHPILQDFSERVRAEEEEEGGGEEGGDEGGMEEEGLVVEQVDKSLKCPITKAYFEEPVTSKVCKHSYSKAAIIAQIRQRWCALSRTMLTQITHDSCCRERTANSRTIKS